MSEPLHIVSRANARLALVRRQLRDAGAYRKSGLLWLEGEHLLDACVAHDRPLRELLVAESAWPRPAVQALLPHAQRVLRVADALFAELSQLDSPSSLGAIVDLPPASPLRGDAATVVLDRLQDAGNVGSILRSAAALGVTQVVALKGSAALWSPKVLRAGMGAHFSLQLHEGLQADQLGALRLPWVGTGSHAATALHRARLPWPCAWVFGHEGQGVDPALARRCAVLLRIEQPGGEESLNVAAAAAICLYESARQRG